jgi:hypothetical protein
MTWWLRPALRWRRRLHGGARRVRHGADCVSAQQRSNAPGALCAADAAAALDGRGRRSGVARRVLLQPSARRPASRVRRLARWKLRRYPALAWLHCKPSNIGQAAAAAWHTAVGVQQLEAACSMHWQPHRASLRAAHVRQRVERVQLQRLQAHAAAASALSPAEICVRRCRPPASRRLPAAHRR